MIKVIDGKRYNTKTATHISSFWNGLGMGDFNHMSENLYRTPKGTFFMVGEGGAMTKYSESYGDSRGDGTKVIVLTQKEALIWAEAHCTEEELEEFFSDIIEDG